MPSRQRRRTPAPGAWFGSCAAFAASTRTMRRPDSARSVEGHTVGLAARMEQIAAPDRTYLTEHTARLVTGFFQLTNLGPSAVKGVHEPLQVYQLEGVGPVRSRLEISGARGFSRFVGREAEMASLEAALTRALEGDGQIMGVVAEAETGKSRLCYEFVQRCRARGVAVYGARGGPRQGRSTAPDPRDHAGVLRHQRAGQRRASAPEDRGDGVAPRQGADRRASAPARVPGRARPRASGAPHGPGSAPPPSARHRRGADPWSEPSRARGAAHGGPALVRRGEPGLRRGRGRGPRWDAHAPAAQFPARVPRRVDAILLQRAAASAARSRGDREPAA